MLRRIATVFAAATALVLGVAGTAYAHDQTVQLVDRWWGYHYGYATWTENGDTLKVCDTFSDGYGVRAYVYVPYTGDEENGTVLLKVSDPSNDGNCASTTKNINETTTISLKVCEYAGATIDSCAWELIPR
jgi:hypothetical protein